MQSVVEANLNILEKTMSEFIDWLMRVHPHMPRMKSCIECTAVEDIKKNRVLEYYGRRGQYKVRHTSKKTKQDRIAGCSESDAKKGEKLWVIYKGNGEVEA